MNVPKGEHNMATDTNLIDLTDADLDALLGLGDAPAAQTYEDILAESNAVLAASRALRANFRGTPDNHTNCAAR